MRTKMHGRIAMFACGVVVATTMAQLDGPPLTSEEVERYEALELYMTPGAQHERLAVLEGTWIVRGRRWAAPGASARSFDGVSEITMIMGGRYLHESVEGDAMGSPYHGLGMLGYDNALRRYVRVRIDSAGTGIVRLEGVHDERADMLQLEGFAPDPGTGRLRRVRTEERMIDENTLLITEYDHDPDGREFTSREMRYERRER